MKNLNLADVCSQYGTPLYLYNINKVLESYNKLTTMFAWKNTKIFYAMKANYNLDILKALRDAGSGIDTVSPTEVILCLKLGFKKEDIIYTANNLTDAEMKLVQEQGVLFNIGSLSRLEKYGKAFPNNNVCLRFNPDVVAGAHKHIQTGGSKTKFGILLEDIEKVKDIINKYSLKVIGIHEHTGSGIADSEDFYQGMKNILSVATKENFPHLEFIDFGGGLKVAYRPDEKKVDYSNFAKEVDKIFSTYCQNYGKDLKMCFEPGKYLVAEAGTLLVQVNTLKNNRGRLIAGTNSGFNHLIRPMLYEAYHHIVNISNPSGAINTYDICGNICESGDLFASDREIAEIREGDYLAIENAGAYGLSMASNYNLRPLPTEVIFKDGKTYISRKAFSHAEFADEIINSFNIND